MIAIVLHPPEDDDDDGGGGGGGDDGEQLKKRRQHQQHQPEVVEEVGGNGNEEADLDRPEAEQTSKKRTLLFRRASKCRGDKRSTSLGNEVCE